MALGAALGVSGCGDDTVEPGEVEAGTAELGGPARGISITDVEVNQGAGVVVATAEDGWLDLEARNARLIHGRDSLVRFQVVLDDPAGWIPRSLTGVLRIEVPGQPTVVRTRDFVVEQDSDPRDLDEQFYFPLYADEALPGTKIHVELRETDASVDVSALGQGRTQVPANGEAATVGFGDVDLEMDIVIVPVHYTYFDPPRVPDITDEDLELLREGMLQQNPVQAVNITVRDEPIIYSQQITDLGTLLPMTRQARIADGAPPHVYYHAMIDVNGSAVNDVAGIAWLTGATQEDGDLRSAATVFHKRIIPADPEDPESEEVIQPPSNTVNTWVHEVGHNQGFRHVECQGATSANNDPSYPYEDGKLGIYGFGIRNFRIFAPSASHDYMSYCGNAWVSDWTWEKAHERVELLTGWGTAAPPSGPDGASTIEPSLASQREPALIGVLSVDGTETWTAMPAFPVVTPASTSALETVEFWADGALVDSAVAEVATLSDGRTRTLTVIIPPKARVSGAQGVAAGFELVRQDAQGQRRAVVLP